MQRYTPLLRLSAYSPLNGRSVAACRVTSKLSGVNCLRQSASVFTTRASSATPSLLPAAEKFSMLMLAADFGPDSVAARSDSMAPRPTQAQSPWPTNVLRDGNLLFMSNASLSTESKRISLHARIVELDLNGALLNAVRI